MAVLEFSSRRWLVVLFLTLGFTAQLPAQHVFCAEHEGKIYIVDKMHSDRVSIQKDGKTMEVSAKRCALTPVEEYRPAFIAVQDMEVKTTWVSAGINTVVHFRAKFETPFVLPDVFVVLVLNYRNGGKELYYREVGSLAPDKPGWLQADLPLSKGGRWDTYDLHLFSGGLEVFHSQQTWQYREEMLDRMVAKHINGVMQANPRPFVAPTPVYPAVLRKSGVRGEAVVAIRVTSRGVVLDPVVESASDPAFGEVALVAIRQWRFLPRVSDGEPVEVNVSVPFGFDPPVAAGKD